MRAPPSPVGGKNCGYLRHPKSSERRLHDHFTRELHAGTREPEFENGLAVESAQSAMKVTDLPDAEEEPSKEAQHRIAQISVQRRHRFRQDNAFEAVTHDEFVSGAKSHDKRGETLEIVT